MKLPNCEDWTLSCFAINDSDSVLLTVEVWTSPECLSVLRLLRKARRRSSRRGGATATVSTAWWRSTRRSCWAPAAQTHPPRETSGSTLSASGLFAFYCSHVSERDWLPTWRVVFVFVFYHKCLYTVWVLSLYYFFFFPCPLIARLDTSASYFSSLFVLRVHRRSYISKQSAVEK